MKLKCFQFSILSCSSKIRYSNYLSMQAYTYIQVISGINSIQTCMNIFLFFFLLSLNLFFYYFLWPEYILSNF
jgi:hypothetical protein